MKTQRTRSQERIFLLLKSINRAISAQELYSELRNRKENMGLATVYRSLEVLKLQGEVQMRTLPTGESLYSSVQDDRHYLTCINCGRSIVLDECPVHDLEHHLEGEHQFKVFYHNLEFFGLCDRCQTS
jgi:Fur family transcriptional regulator, ferric uptake regulator